MGTLCEFRINEKIESMNQRENFVRIAMAQIKCRYPFRPQRLAIASKMYRRWIERKNK